MQRSSVTVLGGTGFLGRRVIRHLLDHGVTVRSASRHPDRGRDLFRDPRSDLDFVHADVNDERSVASAMAGAEGVVNAVSLYVERGGQTYRSVHVDAAARVAREARRAGVRRLAHLSGIGSDPASRSPYIRSRGEGELAVREAFPDATLIRPAVMFGPDDAFLSPLVSLLRRLPVFAMFGRGDTKLQPAYVGDVAEAIARALMPGSEPATAYEFGGPRTYRYEDLLREIARHAGARPVLLPVPFGLWHALGYAAEWLPDPPVTRNQVALMQVDNVAATDLPGFGDLGIAPRSIEEVLPQIVSGP